MDRKLEEKLIAAAERGAYLAMMRANRRLVGAEELCDRFQVFTKDWLDNFGDILPRKKVNIECTISGKKRGTHWGYDILQIAENFDNGLYEDMKLLR